MGRTTLIIVGLIVLDAVAIALMGATIQQTAVVLALAFPVIVLGD